jgi:DNA-binding NtrC family response regulator
MRQIRILLIGTDPGVKQLGRHLLNDRVYVVHQVENGEDAIASMLLERYDVAVIQPQLGRLDSHNLGYALGQLNPELHMLNLNNPDTTHAQIRNYEHESVFDGLM